MNGEYKKKLTPSCKVFVRTFHGATAQCMDDLRETFHKDTTRIFHSSCQDE